MINEYREISRAKVRRIISATRRLPLSAMSRLSKPLPSAIRAPWRGSGTLVETMVGDAFEVFGTASGLPKTPCSSLDRGPQERISSPLTGSPRGPFGHMSPLLWSSSPLIPSL